MKVWWLVCGKLAMTTVGDLEGEGDKVLVWFSKQKHLKRNSQLIFMMYITCDLEALRWQSQGDFSCLAFIGSS